mmetsp:Transcript_20538/g.44575  ORF Transcript_20538/g.44575 Transcript_20538/m.44575 type:complete len:568 (-) Transcript_20538:1001-2704(-)
MSSNGSSDPNGAITHHRNKELVNPSLKGIKYVIFPNNRWAQRWDMVMIMAIWYYAFYIPFHFGISAGYFTVYYDGFMIFNIIVNATFLVDTFLSFFRAYRDKNGRIVYSLKSIRRHYIRSGWFFINILASLPASSFVYAEARAAIDSGATEPLDNGKLRFYFILELFKLLRLVRIKKLMYTSEVMSSIWERINVEIALTMKFVFMMTLVSHWIACIWGLIAFQEAGSFGDPLLEKLNWISHWYDNNYVEGGLDPIGWNKALSRYSLCLFWSIQSITSIGYGNIVPVTYIEYGFANLLMLLCGIFWAYVIGNLVEVVQSMGSINTAYVHRMNEANQMMRDFTERELPESVTGTLYPDSYKRVRRFITNQRDRATKNWLDPSNVCTLHDAYPTLNILSPELQRVCALHLTHSLLETIPFLSSTYLSPEEQADVALQCVTLEFSIAEKFVAHSDLGRGVLIIRQGFAMVSRNTGGENYTWHKDAIDQPIDVNEVLVEDDYLKEHQLVYHFVGFTKVLFVPRSAIMGILEKNERAWKECGRWRYFMAAFILYSLKESGKAGKTIEDFQDCL